MVQSFSQGLIDGFSVIETIRDRRAARANEARRISLQEAASSRAEEAFEQGKIDTTRRRAREDLNEQALSAQARVANDPDNADPDDIRLLEQAGFADTLSALRTRGEQRGAVGQLLSRSPSLGDLATTSLSPQPQVTQSPSDQVTQAPETFMTGLEEEETLPASQFPSQPEVVPIGVVRSVLGRDHPLAKQDSAIFMPPEVANVFKGYADLPTEQQPKALEFINEFTGGLGEDRNEIRQSLFELRRNTRTERRSLVDRWGDIASGATADTDPFFRLAEQLPTSAVNEYAKVRASLVDADPNTAALMDSKISDVLDRSLEQIQEAGRTSIPVDEATGVPNWQSDEAKTVRRFLDQNIALKRAIVDDFSIADEANIRGGAMPVGQEQLVQQVANGWANAPTPAVPMTQQQERLAMTRFNRAEQGQRDQAARRVNTGTLDALTTLVMHGRVTIQDAEQYIRTGRFTQAMTDLVSFPKENDVYDAATGRLLRAGQMSGDELRRARGDFDEGVVGWIDEQFNQIYEDNSYTAATRKNEFITWLQNHAQNGGLPGDAETLGDLTIGDAGTLFNQYIQEQQVINDQESGFFAFMRPSGLDVLGGERLTPEAAEAIRERGGVAPDTTGRPNLALLKQRMAAHPSAAVRQLAQLSDDALSSEIAKVGSVEEFVRRATGAQ